MYDFDVFTVKEMMSSLSSLEKEGVLRLSIDEEIWVAHGRYGIDFPIEKLSLKNTRKLQKENSQSVGKVNS